MSKSLVVCCDGTWNRPDELSGGLVAPTNVSKIALGLASHRADGAEQRLFYQRGVGTRKWQHFRGGAFGYGLSRNIRACYRFIVGNYEPGDSLYLFGFSRGAYTARSTVGLIRNCGILRPSHRKRINEAYRLYRSRSARKGPSTIESQIFQRMYSHEDIEVHFIGVWDTVGSLGIPIDGFRVTAIRKYWGFHDTALSSRVHSAYQALAIDELRAPFKPTIWTQQEHAKDQILEQTWFAGVHKDVGGGYEDPSLSEIPLLWMVDRARERGLAFRPQYFHVGGGVPDREQRCLGTRLAPDPLGEIHESRKSFYKLIKPVARTLGHDEPPPASPAGQTGASSALARRRERTDYHPLSLDRWTQEGWPEFDVDV
jgi:uncharacterized protein (DUF2235 family)